MEMDADYSFDKQLEWLLSPSGNSAEHVNSDRIRGKSKPETGCEQKLVSGYMYADAVRSQTTKQQIESLKVQLKILVGVIQREG
ncbi:hypothetical protein BGZ79_004866 [Entomortierella chlamydospora]|nr:hypothetical protein BGZ79_004866 [Entomortierella chlamydospora]